MCRPICTNLRKSNLLDLSYALSSGVENPCLAFCGTESPAETIFLGVFRRGFQPRNTGDRDFQSLAQAILPRLWLTMSTKILKLLYMGRLMSRPYCLTTSSTKRAGSPCVPLARYGIASTRTLPSVLATQFICTRNTPTEPSGGSAD